MDSFIWLHGTYINLLAVDNIKPVSEEYGGEYAELRYPSGEVVHVRGYDARVLLAKLRDEPSDEVEVREKSGAGYTLAGSTLTDAQKQAQELTKTLGGSQGRTFDFQDSTGQNRRGTVYKESSPGTESFGWTAEVDGVKYSGSSEAAAMAAAMSGVA